MVNHPLEFYPRENYRTFELSLFFFFYLFNLTKLTDDERCMVLRVKFHESVREADVYIVATASSEIVGTNGALME